MRLSDREQTSYGNGQEPTHLTKEEMRQKIKASLAAKEGLRSDSASSSGGSQPQNHKPTQATPQRSNPSHAATEQKQANEYTYSEYPKQTRSQQSTSRTNSTTPSHSESRQNHAGGVATAAKPIQKTHPRQYHKQKPVQERNPLIPLVVVVATILVAILVVYFGGMAVYAGKFLPKTFVNGINIAGMTEDEAKEAILQTAQESGLIFIPRDGEQIVFKGSSFGCTVTLPENCLDGALEENHAGWFKKLFSETDYTVELSESYSESDVASLIAAYDWGNVPPTDATIVQNEDGTFSIQPEDDGNMVDTQVLSDYTLEQMRQGNNTISMTASNCYESAAVTADDLTETLELYNQIGSVEMVYDMTDREECLDPVGTETLDNETIMSWISTENGEITVDEEAATAWIQENIADKYDTLVTGYVRTFQATMDGTIQLPIGVDGIYGWKTNVDATVEKLIGRIKNGESATVEPVYKVEGFRMNSNSGVVYTGDTYIEVDICNQKLWYYENGELFLESDVVTGLASDEERATPPGAYMVWSRESPRKLGTYAVQGYETWVDYWMPVTYTGIGLHDLSRSAYGGDIYLTNGSHGCINLPLDIAKKIYDEVTISTPVMIIP
jgi:hypothetical protein